MNRGQQLGFTVVEIAVGLFLTLVIISFLVTSLATKTEDEHMFEARLFFLKQANEAIVRFRLKGGEITNILKTDLTNYNLRADTPWGDSWTLQPSGANVQFNWPLTSARDPAASCQALASVIPQNNTNVFSAACGGTTLTVVLKGQ